MDYDYEDLAGAIRDMEDITLEPMIAHTEQKEEKDTSLALARLQSDTAHTNHEVYEVLQV